MTKRAMSDEISQIAAQWAARSDAGTLHEEDQAILDAWLAQDSRHLGAFAMAQATLVRLDAARALGSAYDPSEFLTGTAGLVPELADDNGAADRKGWFRYIGRSRWSFAAGALAAALIVAIVLAPWDQAERYKTAVGEMRRITLDDGSIVNMNTHSSIEILFSEDKRIVRLIDGEAQFEVAKDKGRPFIVEAGGTEAVAVGTAFTVRREDDMAVRVVVSEGVVEFARKGRASPRVSLAPNMQGEAASDANTSISITNISPEEMARELYWRDGKIGFSDTTLENAAKEFSRYNNTIIDAEDPQVRHQKITGLFSANDPRGFAKSVSIALDLHATYEKGKIKLSD